MIGNPLLIITIRGCKRLEVLLARDLIMAMYRRCYTKDPAALTQHT